MRKNTKLQKKHNVPPDDTLHSTAAIPPPFREGPKGVGDLRHDNGMPDDELRSAEGVPEVGAAVLGGIGGGLLGAVAGATTGPVGAIAGAVLGSTLGSLAGASLAADREAHEGAKGPATFDDDREAHLPGHAPPGIQTGGEAVDGTPDTRGILEKTADALTGDTTDDKTGKRVRSHDLEIGGRKGKRS